MRVTMQQDHPDMMAVRQLGCRVNSTFEPWDGLEPARSESAPHPEADDVACEAAEPADHNQGAEAQRARVRGVAREQPEQQAVRGRIREYKTVDRIAMVANEIEERGEVRRKQQDLTRDALLLPD